MIDLIEISVSQNPLGEFVVIDDNTYDGAPDAGRQDVGFGQTEDEALADFFQQRHDNIVTDLNDDDEWERDSYDDSMDGDHESALASAGWGTDEDYGYYGGDDDGW